MSIKTVWDALTSYCYLPRLRDQAVFVEAVQEGIAGGEYFAYATSVSEEGRYEGLKLGAKAAAIYVDTASVLVKTEVARTQIGAESEEPATEQPQPGPEPRSSPHPSDPGSGEEPRETQLPRRFFGTVQVDADRAGRDMGKVAEAVLQHLTTQPGGKVKVTVEIQAEVPKGVSADVQRVVDENCRTLRFTAHGFERS